MKNPIVEEETPTEKPVIEEIPTEPITPELQKVTEEVKEVIADAPKQGEVKKVEEEVIAEDKKSAWPFRIGVVCLLGGLSIAAFKAYKVGQNTDKSEFTE